MSRKRRAHAASPAKSAPVAHSRETGSVRPAVPSAPRLKGWRKWLARAALAVLVPALFLVAVELALRVVGFGHSTRFFQKSEDGRSFTTNRRFGWQFMSRDLATQPYPVTMPLKKEKSTRRIFILGESAAQGTPAPAFGFARILEVMLAQQFPEQKFEVINAAMRGINSHAIRPIARECAEFDPDLFILYAGNNEAIGFYAPEPGRFNLTQHPRLIRFVQWLKGTRLAQLLANTTRALRKEPSKREKQDMEYFRRHALAVDDPLREAVVSNFRRNLDAIVETVQDSGARMIVATVGVNLLDFPPLASRHRAGLSADELSRWEAAYKDGAAAEAKGEFATAIQHFQQAEKIDDHFAELYFRLGRSFLASGDTEKARRHFALARDWDALQFRADNRMNGVVRELAANRKDSVVFVDAERAFATGATSEHGIPGNRFFYEHVHLTFDGDYLLAQMLLPAVVAAVGLAGNPTNSVPRAIPSRQECAEALAFSAWDELGTKAAMVRQTANPPFLDQLDYGQRQARAEGEIAERTRAFNDPALREQSISVYRAAFARRPDDWHLHLSLANLLNDFGQFGPAAEEFAVVVRAQPDFLSARLLLGTALWRAGRPEEAVAQFEEVLRREPKHSIATTALSDTLKTARSGR